ncbi:uncharacterized protein LOC109542770 [Dendroctonus ponderosae]|uniref:uncharacterized protein LOC109542770 n=1 Tax=Dendroctonus ponderosae TaxID=77166 RepID=UPI002034C7F9|nr:uncharacterized protein LOC109542770 [Dendroctonus ponderosae]
MKLLPVFVLVVLWVGSSSSPVKTEGGIVSTLSSSARYVGKKLHIIKKRQLGQVDSESKELKTNELELEGGSEHQNQPNETEISNRTKRAQGSDDPRYILVHDVPPCKKRRSAEDYEQPLPACSTPGGKNITIIIQNSMEAAEKHRLTRGAETAEGNGNISPSENAAAEETAKTDQVADLKLSDPEREQDRPRSAEEVNNLREAEQPAAGRKLLWTLDDEEPLPEAPPFLDSMWTLDDEGPLAKALPFLDSSPQTDPQPFNFLHASGAIDKSLSDQQQHFKADQKQDKNAEVVVDRISLVASHAFCVCVVTNTKCSPYVNGFRAWEQSDTVNCTRACSKLADCCCEVNRAEPIKSTDNDVSASERAKHLDQTLYLEVAWIIILMLNILVGINTIVIGYVCWKGPNKKKSVFLVHGYANTPPARA